VASACWAGARECLCVRGDHVLCLVAKAGSHLEFFDNLIHGDRLERRIEPTGRHLVLNGTDDHRHVSRSRRRFGIVGMLRQDGAIDDGAETSQQAASGSCFLGGGLLRLRGNA